MSSSPVSAPIRVFISYSHDSPEHMEKVLKLADRLRGDGIDATVDQYLSAPPEGWPAWTARQISEADYVLVVCTKTYLRRFDRKEELGKGFGVAWEGMFASQEIYQAIATNTKFIPLLFEGAEPADIPGPLKPTTHYWCTNDKEYEELYRRLTNQPFIEKPVLGKLKSLARRQRLLDPKPLKPWNVPQERNPVFTGREEILIQLRRDLVKNRKQALSGLGGIGKSQIAVEYAYRHRDAYGAVFWAFGDSEQSVNTSFTSIAGRLDLPEKDDADQAVVVNAVKHWLDENQDWLLIFDNADSPTILSKFLLHDPRGHILLTSRAHTFQSLGILEPLDISVLPFDAAVQFLLKRTARGGTAERTDAEVLAKELGCLPLALEQAAAYIVENQSSFKNYLASYQKQGLKLLEKQGPALGNLQEQQKRTVATTWALNFADIQKNSPASVDLLRISAFLAPDPIPLELLEKGGAKMGERLASELARIKDNKLIIDELLKPLTSYSLVRRNPKTQSFSIHLLVQEVIKEGLTQGTKKAYVQRVVNAVADAFPAAEFENWPDCDRLLPHALACARTIDSFNLKSVNASLLLNNAAHYMTERARYAQAELLSSRALEISKTIYGPSHVFTAVRLNNLADIYRRQRKYSGAESLLQEAIRIKEKALGTQDYSTAASLNVLALVYQEQGKYEDAEQLLRRSLAIREKVLGPKHPGTATGLNNLALLFKLQGKYQEAEPLYCRALEIRESALDPNHPETATNLNNLAKLYERQERYAEAEPLYRRALEILRTGLGSKHPNTVTTAENLIDCYRVQQKDTEAEELQQWLTNGN